MRRAMHQEVGDVVRVPEVRLEPLRMIRKPLRVARVVVDPVLGGRHVLFFVE